MSCNSGQWLKNRKVTTNSVRDTHYIHLHGAAPIECGVVTFDGTSQDSVFGAPLISCLSIFSLAGLQCPSASLSLEPAARHGHGSISVEQLGTLHRISTCQPHECDYVSPCASPHHRPRHRPESRPWNCCRHRHPESRPATRSTSIRHGQNNMQLMPTVAWHISEDSLPSRLEGFPPRLRTSETSG